jgi:uncharacterized lipoprotein YbaY
MASNVSSTKLNILPALLFAVALLLPACSTPAPNGLVTGTMNYSERVTLAPGSTATVELVRLGGSPTTIATNSFQPTGPVPFPFTLTYDPTRIDVTIAHALRARITSPDGAMLFMTPVDVPIDFDGSPVALQLQSVGAGGGGTSGTTRR